MKRKTIALLAVLLMCVMVLSSCASHGKTLIVAGKEEISVNVFQLYLSRMKGSLAEAGYPVTEDSYWGTYISTDHTTTADHYTSQVLEGLKHIAAAMILYEEYGLKLPDETVDEIDAWIEELIKTDGEGSKATLNSILSAYGANVTVLRDACIIEAKLAQLKTHLYGEGGALIADTAIEEYYKATYYRGYQMQIANYYYDHEKDKDGVAVRYTDDTYEQVAYISQSTLDTLDEAERAKYVTVPREGAYAEKFGSAYGNTLTLYRDGETEVVAYDKEKGVICYNLDGSGNMVIVEYSEAEMQARYERAREIAAECVNDEAKFLRYASEVSDNSNFNETYAPNGMYFALGTYSTDNVFGTFSTTLAQMDIGTTRVVSSSAGYYILMRVELDTAAWKNDANARWFSTLRGMTLEHMLQKRTTAYLDRVTVDEELLAGVSIKGVASNVRY